MRSMIESYSGIERVDHLQGASDRRLPECEYWDDEMNTIIAVAAALHFKCVWL